MKNIILIAPPAAGKGTQSKLICEKYNIPHISIGDLIRNNLNDKSELTKLIKKQMNSGKLIDDEIILKLLEKRLGEKDCLNGYILDGFPRNLNQAIVYDRMLNDSNKEIGNVILLDVSEEVIKKRILGRMTCPNCGKIYNKLFENTKPRIKGLCDVCKTELKVREDDNEETFNKRYQTYLAETKPLIKYYKEKEVLKIVDGNLSKDQIFNQIESIIKSS